MKNITSLKSFVIVSIAVSILVLKNSFIVVAIPFIDANKESIFSDMKVDTVSYKPPIQSLILVPKSVKNLPIEAPTESVSSNPNIFAKRL